MQVIAAALILVLAQVGGTQPGELTNPLSAPTACTGCHGGYAEYAPQETWSGSLMANAMRDPLFLAALTIANQDVPNSGELCIRCHTPRGWLAGRGVPTDGSALVAGDYEGIDCDFCHRMTPGPGGDQLIGNGQFFVANDVARRGTLTNANTAPHAWQYSAYHESAELCGVCHDVSNPLNNQAIERTYTEWKNSAFPAEGITCQTCHMPKVQNAYTAIPSSGAPPRSTGRHDFVGGNSWMPLVLAGAYPELGREAAFQYTAQRALEALRSSAELTFYVDGKPVADGEAPVANQSGRFDLKVRVENLTGHKLPTGYPEGRRSWLEVKVEDMEGALLYHSGVYDRATARRIDDADIRTYEVRLAHNGVEGFHFVLTDEILQDNRIPPRGFVATPDTQPVGRLYPTLPDGTLASWDDAPYSISIPETALLGPARVTATLWYQTTSREYIEFLRDENYTDDRGEVMYSLWEQFDRAPPVDMATVSMVIDIQPPASCGCDVPGRSRKDAPVLWLAALAVLLLVRGYRAERRRARR